MFYGKKAAPAKRVLQSFLKKTRLEETPMGFRVEDRGVIGWDGHNATGEIRPKPSKDPKKLAENIGMLYSKIYEHLPFIDVTTLSIGETVGGHIHLEIPQSKIEEITDNKALQTKFGKVIATLLIPILASEHKLCAASRYSTSYGKATDLRIGTTGENNEAHTVEVRGLTAEWTVTEEIANATLAYLGVVWHEMLNNINKITKNPLIFRNNTQITGTQEMLLSDYRPMINALVTEAHTLVKTFELYPLFKEEVDLIMDYEAVKKKKEEVGWNVNKGWNFTKTPKLTKKELLKERVISKRLKEINYENVRGDFSLSYNEDYNVEMFTNAVSERIAALNWGLKNEYFFFGLKKEDVGFLAANLGEDKFFSVPSNRSKEKTLDTLTKMRNRFMEFRGTSIRINPKTGKTIGGKREYIMIGIPYDIRADKNVKPLISLLYDIEQEKLKPRKYEDIPTISEKNSPEPIEENEALLDLRDIPTIDTESIARSAFRGSDGTELNN